MSATIRPPNDQLTELADLIAELRDLIAELRESNGKPPARFVDVPTLAAILGVSTDTIYRNANRLGAMTLSDGSRARLRFDLEAVPAAISRATVVEPPPKPKPRARRKRRTVNDPSSVLAVRRRS